MRIKRADRRLYRLCKRSTLTKWLDRIEAFLEFRTNGTIVGSRPVCLSQPMFSESAGPKKLKFGGLKNIKENTLKLFIPIVFSNSC